MYSYIDYYTADYSLATIPVDSDDFATGTYDRADAPSVFVCQFICIVCFVWILNQLTKIVRKDGALH